MRRWHFFCWASEQLSPSHRRPGVHRGLAHLGDPLAVWEARRRCRGGCLAAWVGIVGDKDKQRAPDLNIKGSDSQEF